MIRAVRSELMKLRRPRLWYATTAALFGFTTLVTVLSVATAAEQPKDRAVPIAHLTAATGATAGFANASRLVGLVILVLFLTSVTTEYSLGTVRTLLTRQPRRPILLTGKFLALLLATATALLAALLLSVATATIAMRARGLPTAAWFTTEGLTHAAAAYGNALAACTAYGAAGLATGVLLRSTVLAVGASLAWFFMAENIAANLWPHAEHWLPGLLAGAVMAGGTATTPYGPALAATLSYAATALLVALISFTRRDIRS